MSRKKGLGRSLFDILRSLGVKVDRKVEDAVVHEREVEHSTTADIITRLSIAPPEVLEKAVAIAREEGSTELLSDRVSEAMVATEKTSVASKQLTELAAAIAAKES